MIFIIIINNYDSDDDFFPFSLSSVHIQVKFDRICFSKNGSDNVLFVWPN